MSHNISWSHRGTLTYHKLFDEMTPQEGVLYLQGLRDRLSRKQQRERAYLDRRARRGAHTPTDDAYEEDQRLESELISFLNDLTEQLAERLATEVEREGPTEPRGWKDGITC